MKYLSNLNRLEFDGKLYDQGDHLTVNADNRGAADILVKRGQATLIADGDPPVTTNGDSSEPAPGTGAEDFGSMKVGDLRNLAQERGVALETDDNKADIIRKLEDAAAA
ncbi:MAG: SAP domain-containing protein [Sphingomonas sp.]|nr:SAP domain-containing protein [Sphingomonas sp.]